MTKADESNSGDEKKFISTVNEFLQWVKEDLKSNYGFIFRGLSNAKWDASSASYRRTRKRRPLNPSMKARHGSAFVRLDVQRPTLEIDYIADLIDKSKARRFHKRDGHQTLSDFELLAELQHQGAATFLMDCTRDSLVALWMACQERRIETEIETEEEDPQEQQEKDTKETPAEDSQEIHTNGKVLAFYQDAWITKLPETASEEKIAVDRELTREKLHRILVQYGPNDIEMIRATGRVRLWTWEPLRLNERVSAQKSIFLFGRSPIQKTSNDSVVYEEVFVESESKKHILAELERNHGISGETLFPDLPGFAQENAHDRPININFAFYYKRMIQAISAENYEFAQESLDWIIQRSPTTLDYRHIRVAIARKSIEQGKQLKEDYTYFMVAQGYWLADAWGRADIKQEMEEFFDSFIPRWRQTDKILVKTLWVGNVSMPIFRIKLSDYDVWPIEDEEVKKIMTLLSSSKDRKS